MAFNIDENVRIVTATLIYVKVKYLAELNQGNCIALLTDGQCCDAILQAIVFTDCPVVIDDGIGHKPIVVVFLLVFFGSFCYQHTF